MTAHFCTKIHTSIRSKIKYVAVTFLGSAVGHRVTASIDLVADAVIFPPDSIKINIYDVHLVNHYP
jgi:hypothetical protein